jgi:hypothetical protein
LNECGSLRIQFKGERNAKFEGPEASFYTSL